MKNLTLFVATLLITLGLAAQELNKFDDFSKVHEGINKNGTHSLHIDYSYGTSTDEANQQLVYWRTNSGGAGYLFAITRNINIGIEGLFSSYECDERVGYETDTNGVYQFYTYYHTASSFALLLKGQFFWFNRSPYIGLYSSYALGKFLDKPVANTYLTSGSPQSPPAGYYGSSKFIGNVDGYITLIGADFRFGKESHWYFYGELVLFPVVRGGLGYRF